MTRNSQDGIEINTNSSAQESNRRIVFFALRGVALVFISAAIIFNPWTLENLISPDGHFDFAWIFWAFFFVDASMLLVSCLMYIRPELFWNYRDHIIAWCVVGVMFLGLAELTLRFHEMWYVHRTGVAMNAEAELDPGAVVSLGNIIKPAENEQIVYMLKPNINVMFGDVSVQTNTTGFREKEFTMHKTNDTIRIVGLGDSVMFGWGVREEERYMDVLERLLNESYPEYSWETYTLAVPGWNAVIIQHVFETYGVALLPDLILYGYIDNDPCLPGFIRKETGFFSGGPRLLRLIDPYMPYKSSFLEWMRGMPLYMICDPRDATEKYKSFVGPEAFTRAVMDMVWIADREDAPLYILSLGSFFHYLRNVEEAVIDDLREHFLDMSGVFGPVEENRELYLSESDLHPSPYGHEKIAEFLFKQMQDRGVIDALIEKHTDNEL